jgi:signal recognition particle subunit SRP54
VGFAGPYPARGSGRARRYTAVLVSDSLKVGPCSTRSPTGSTPSSRASPAAASLSEEDVAAGLREIRLALLEADVNFKVVKTFVSRIKERAVGTEVSEALNPGQQVVKIVHEELVRILGEQSAPLDLGSASPAVVMLAGLQGSGKTTAAGKLALHLKSKGRSADARRLRPPAPAAVQQLTILGEQVGVPVYAPPSPR